MGYFIQKHNQLWFWNLKETTLYDSHALIVWDYLTFKDEIQFAKELGKKIVLYQHGRYALEQYSHYTPDTQLNIDGLMVWGSHTKKEMASLIDEKKILCVGNKWVDQARKHRKEVGTKDSYTILYPILHWWTPFIKENVDHLQKILSFLRPQDKLIIKTINKAPWNRYKNHIVLGDNVTVVETKVESDSGQLESIATLQDVDLIFSPKESTYELYARAMGIEIINIENDNVRKLQFNGNAYSENNKPFQNRHKLTQLNFAYERFIEGYRTAKLFNVDNEVSPLATDEQLDNFITNL